jgi:S-DNA-T family DNA segregation ATPase FtsK/SpoIIIE
VDDVLNSDEDSSDNSSSGAVGGQFNFGGGVNNKSGKLSEDDYYTQAIEVVKRDKKCSISYIQRQLRIGYNKAANLVERMERDGILSEPSRTGRRQILIDGEN